MRMNGPLSGTVGFRSVTDRTASINSTPIDHSTFQRDEIFEFQSFRSCQRALKIFLKIPPLPSLLSLSFHDKIWNPLEYIYIYIRSLKILESRFYYEKRNSRNYRRLPTISKRSNIRNIHFLSLLLFSLFFCSKVETIVFTLPRRPNEFTSRD